MSRSKKSTPEVDPDIAALGEQGRRLWDALAAVYEYDSPAERGAVLAICRATDTEHEIQQCVEVEGVSQHNGSRVFAHPLLAEQRHLRNMIANFLTTFAAAAVNGEARTPTTSSAIASAAARTRWARDARGAV